MAKSKKPAPPLSQWESMRGAIAGDEDAARQMLAMLAADLRERAPGGWTDLVAEMLERVAVGEDAAIALMVKNKRGQSKTSFDMRARIYTRMTALLAEEPKEHKATLYRKLAKEENARSNKPKSAARAELDAKKEATGNSADFEPGERGIEQIYTPMKKAQTKLKFMPRTQAQIDQQTAFDAQQRSTADLEGTRAAEANIKERLEERLKQVLRHKKPKKSR